MTFNKNEINTEKTKSTDQLFKKNASNESKPTKKYSLAFKKKLIFGSVFLFNVLVVLAITVILIWVITKDDNSLGKNDNVNNTTKPSSNSTSFLDNPSQFPLRETQNCFGYAISNCSLECGITESVSNNWSSTVLIKVKYNFIFLDYNKIPSFQCTGSLIDELTVLTSAHCVQPQIKLKYKNTHIGFLDHAEVFFGVNNSDSYEYSIRSSKIIIHKNYDSQNLLNNIALVKLSRKAALGQRVKIACLPTKTIDIQANLKLIAVGWNAVSKLMRQVDLTIYDLSLCSKKDPRTQICAGVINKGKDECLSDEGGPLFTQQINNGITKLVVSALASYDSDCSLSNFKKSYSRTDAFINWILENI